MEPKPQDLVTGKGAGRGAGGSGWNITDSFLKILGAILLAIVFVLVAWATGNDDFRTALIGFIGACVGFLVGTGTSNTPLKK